ncbi:MAG TPA: type 1 glutamine amidotransferase domain-containing protein [Armatimonadaceae bacterium]|nr:type 1 glutamine amidotransferase domain-containing protein [Armatimonadaceae bacterium]
MDIKGKQVAILVTDGFEQVELTEPRKALEEAGLVTHLISPIGASRVRGWDHDHWGDEIPVDFPIEAARPDDYDALLLPGGVMNSDKLRMDENAVRFVSAFKDAGKPIAAICHAPWILIEAGVVEGRALTSYPSLQTDLRNAGGEWRDEEVVTDNGLVTSRKPEDIPAFNRKFIEEIGEGVHESGKKRTRETVGV